MSLPLPQDIAACHTLIGELSQECQQLRERESELHDQIAAMENQLAEQDQTIEEQQTTIDRLHADLKLLKRTVFGSRRERYVDDPQQGFLFDTTEVGGAKKENSADQETEQPSIPKRRRTSKGRGRRVFPEFFPRTSVYHELTDEEIPEDLRNDPSAKRFFKKTSERLELTPAKLEIIEEYQEVIARDEPTGETTMLTAPKPAPLIDSYAGPGLLAYLTVSRFADHLPYYRQEDILSRYGFRIGRSTQWRWMFALADRVLPLVDLMRNLALQSLVLGVDETPVRMLSQLVEGILKSYLWGYCW